MFERVSTNTIAAATHQAEADSLASTWPAGIGSLMLMLENPPLTSLNTEQPLNTDTLQGSFLKTHRTGSEDADH